ncbi:hypothetical protein GZH47_16465 [Paenibacillus rhizovicinus]|uniref:Uncharacterized protein n=1 Tax=Paenibacillus rhizovicinus TaxID=2704463 RepID=A0A6C0P192_9BACL|nr:hypothetical protein [Paenibacillus rhizovicinus]QHW32238.1 hypothetical protein GZH47_16465 [Paenibacillus rhizovicinus]
MQLTVADNYQTTIEILATLVKDYLAKPERRFALAKVDERMFLLITAILEQEDDEQAEFELTAELLGTPEFRRIA